MLTVTEIFRSIQGESAWAGWPCVFVRLAGCNLRCRYCDTAYAYAGGTPRSVSGILADVAAFGPGLVEVTGGEPLLQPETPQLLEQLCNSRPVVLLETNGSLALPAGPRPYHTIMDLKCPSSGESARMEFANLRRLRPGDNLKFVVADRTDFDWACARFREAEFDPCAVTPLVSPVAGAADPAELAEWILESGLPLRLQLQLHRVLWPDTDRGV